MINFKKMQLTEDIHSKIDEFEVDFAQGYYLGKPAQVYIHLIGDIHG